MAVKQMTRQGPQGQWVIFGPHTAFSWRPDTQKRVDFTSTETGWDLTVELEPPNAANKYLQEAQKQYLCDIGQAEAEKSAEKAAQEVAKTVQNSSSSSSYSVNELNNDGLSDIPAMLRQMICGGGFPRRQ